MNSNIRAYHHTDKKALLEILRLHVPLYFAASEVADFDHYLDHERELYYVIESAGVLVGAGGINFANEGAEGKISWDFIHPDYQGQGVGGDLLAYRLKLLSTMRDVKTVSVRTSQLAYRFYEKHGFSLEEVTKDYWATGFDLYKMVLEQ